MRTQNIWKIQGKMIFLSSLLLISACKSNEREPVDPVNPKNNQNKDIQLYLHLSNPFLLDGKETKDIPQGGEVKGFAWNGTVPTIFKYVKGEKGWTAKGEREKMETSSSWFFVYPENHVREEMREGHLLLYPNMRGQVFVGKSKPGSKECLMTPLLAHHRIILSPENYPKDPEKGCITTISVSYEGMEKPVAYDVSLEKWVKMEKGPYIFEKKVNIKDSPFVDVFTMPTKNGSVDITFLIDGKEQTQRVSSLNLSASSTTTTTILPREKKDEPGAPEQPSERLFPIISKMKSRPYESLNTAFYQSENEKWTKELREHRIKWDEFRPAAWIVEMFDPTWRSVGEKKLLRNEANIVWHRVLTSAPQYKPDVRGWKEIPTDTRPRIMLALVDENDNIVEAYPPLYLGGEFPWTFTEFLCYVTAPEGEYYIRTFLEHPDERNVWMEVLPMYRQDKDEGGKLVIDSPQRIKYDTKVAVFAKPQGTPYLNFNFKMWYSEKGIKIGRVNNNMGEESSYRRDGSPGFPETFNPRENRDVIIGFNLLPKTGERMKGKVFAKYSNIPLVLTTIDPKWFEENDSYNTEDIDSDTETYVELEVKILRTVPDEIAWGMNGQLEQRISLYWIPEGKTKEDAVMIRPNLNPFFNYMSTYRDTEDTLGHLVDLHRNRIRSPRKANYPVFYGFPVTVQPGSGL